MHSRDFVLGTISKDLIPIEIVILTYILKIILLCNQCENLIHVTKKNKENEMVSKE